MTILQRDHFEGCTDFASHYLRALKPTDLDRDALSPHRIGADGKVNDKEALQRAVFWTLTHFGEATMAIEVKDPNYGASGGIVYRYTGTVITPRATLAPKGHDAPVVFFAGEAGPTAIPYDLILDIEVRP